MKSTQLVLAIGCIALPPLSFVSAAKPNGRTLPPPSTAREVNYEVISGDEIQFAGETSPAGCLTCDDCEVATGTCGEGVTCGLTGCGSCNPCGSPLGECNANCFCPQIKRRLYKIPCATACCEPPRVGSVLIEACDALRSRMYDLKQTGFNRCDDGGCSDGTCTDSYGGPGACGDGLFSSGLLGRCFGATICDDGCGVDCSGGCGGALGCTSCGDACGGSCGGDCGVGFLGGGRLAGFLAACRSCLLPTCPPEGCGSYWGQFDSACIDGGCSDSGCVEGDCSGGGCSGGGCSGGGCSGGGCSGGGCSGGSAANIPNGAWTPSVAKGPLAGNTTRLTQDIGAPSKTYGGLLGFLFPRGSQPSDTLGMTTAARAWNGAGGIRTAKTRMTSGDPATPLPGNVQIVSTQDRRVGEPVVQSNQQPLDNHRGSVTSTARGKVTQEPPAVSRVDYHTPARRPSIKRTAAQSRFWR